MHTRNFIFGISLTFCSCSSNEDIGIGEKLTNLTDKENFTISTSGEESTNITDMMTSDITGKLTETSNPIEDSSGISNETTGYETTGNESTGNESTGENLECECDNNDSNCHNCIRDRLIFVTSEDVFGDWGKSPTLDDKCNQLAYKAGLLDGYDKRFNTWISTSKIDARDRFYHSPGRYVLVDGTVIANNWDDLVDGSIQNPIELDENGEIVHDIVWTGTHFDGTKIEGNLCNDWTIKELITEGYYGYSVDANQWTEVNDGTGPAYCGEWAYLYCIEFE